MVRLVSESALFCSTALSGGSGAGAETDGVELKEHAEKERRSERSIAIHL